MIHNSNHTVASIDSDNVVGIAVDGDLGVVTHNNRNDLLRQGVELNRLVQETIGNSNVILENVGNGGKSAGICIIERLNKTLKKKE